MALRDQKKTARRIEINTAIVYMIAVALAIWLGSREVAIGVAVGGAVSLINFDLLRWILGKVFEYPSLVRGYYFLYLVLKMGGLIALLWVLIGRGLVRADAFAVGFSVILAGIVIEGLRSHWSAKRSPSGEEGAPGDQPRYISDVTAANLERESNKRMLR